VTTAILNLLLFLILVTWFISISNWPHFCRILWTFFSPQLICYALC